MRRNRNWEGCRYLAIKKARPVKKEEYMPLGDLRRKDNAKKMGKREEKEKKKKQTGKTFQ